MVPLSSTGSRGKDLLLGILFSFAALNAFGGGWYGMAGAEGVPVEWLNGTPFTSYFIPSLILFVIVGGAFLAAAVSFFRHHALAVTFGYIVIAIVLVWLVVQILMIGYVSWMQPATAIYSMLLVLLLLPSPRRSTAE